MNDMTLFTHDKKERTALCFDKATLKQDKDGNKSARMRFALRLDPEVALASPPEIKAAYEAVETRENSICYVELDKEISGVNMEFYSLPEAKALSASFASVELTELAVERTERRSVPHLLFSVAVPLDESPKLRHWIVDCVFLQLWAHLEMAQMSFVSPGMADAMADMVSGVDGKGITSMSMEIKGEPDSKVTITAEDAKNIRASAKRIRKEARPN